LAAPGKLLDEAPRIARLGESEVLETVDALRAKLPGMIFDLIEGEPSDVVIELTAHSSESIAPPKAA